MKAMVLTGPNRPFELRQVPDPVAAPGEAVARVFTCGSGLTIQHVKAGRRKAEFPRIIGHEITGEIVETGAGVTSLKVGDPVTAYFYLSCGQCRWCLSNLEPLCPHCAGNVGIECDGGYAEYMKLPAHLFIKLPEGVRLARSSGRDRRRHRCARDALQGAARARVAQGETVAVFGAGGGLGIHQLMLAKWARTRVIAVDVAADKFDACRKAGADEMVDASRGNVVEALLDLTGGEGIDVAIDYVSTTATLEAGAKALGRRGRLVTLGGAGQPFTASPRDMLMKEQELLGSRYVTRREILETFDLVARARGVAARHRHPPAGRRRGRACAGRAQRGDRARGAHDRLIPRLCTVSRARCSASSALHRRRGTPVGVSPRNSRPRPADPRAQQNNPGPGSAAQHQAVLRCVRDTWWRQLFTAARCFPADATRGAARRDFPAAWCPRRRCGTGCGAAAPARRDRRSRQVHPAASPP